jgi:hypothetical protein
MVSLLFSEPLYLVSVKSIKSHYATVTESTSFMPPPPPSTESFLSEFLLLFRLDNYSYIIGLLHYISLTWEIPDWTIYGDGGDNRSA